VPNPTALACPEPEPFLPGWYDEARLADLRRSIYSEAAPVIAAAVAAQFESLGATPPPFTLRLVQS
jgi:hypothetical protein